MEITIKNSNLWYRRDQMFDVAFCKKDDFKGIDLKEGMSKRPGDYYFNRDPLLPSLIYRRDATISHVDILGKEKPYVGMEHSFQKAAMDYLKIKGLYAIHIPNEGKRSGRRGNHLKSQGLTPGFVDILVFEPLNGLCGLAIELKVEGGEYRTNQFEHLQRLAKKGWHSVVCWNMDSLIKIVNELLQLKKNSKIKKQ